MDERTVNNKREIVNKERDSLKTRHQTLQDMTIRLIKLFREKRILWDPTVTDFKNRNKKHDAWAEISSDMEVDVNKVDKKMRMLIGQFQREFKKGKSGDAADAPYKTKWNFFNSLLFLKDKNEPRHSTEGGFSHSSSNQNTVQSQDINNTPLIENDGQSFNESHQVQNDTESCQQKAVDKSIPHKSKVKSTKRKVDEMSEEAYAVMKQLASNVKKRDEFDVFGEHVASTLRNLKSRSIQSCTKFEISRSLYRAEINDEQISNSTSSPATFSDTFGVSTPDPEPISTPISFDVTSAPSNHSWSTEKK